MIRGFWLALPLLLVVFLDGAFTLLGQPTAYWHGNPSGVIEGSQVGTYFLKMGPKGFALGMAALAGAYVLLSAALPRFLGYAVYGAAALGHAWGSSFWVPGLLQRGLLYLGTPLETLVRSRHRFDYYSTLGYFVLLAAVPVFCWQRAGMLPADPSKPGKGPKDDKKKDG